MHLPFKAILCAKNVEHRFYLQAQLLGWLLMAFVWYSLYAYSRIDTHSTDALLMWHVMMYLGCLTLTHFILRPLYWWLRGAKWRDLQKITVYLLAIHVCVWVLLSADRIYFWIYPVSIKNFDWVAFDVVFLYHVVIITWALIYHFWASANDQQEPTPKENATYYVAFQLIGWSLVCGFWYVLYTGRGAQVKTDMAVFWPWIMMVCISGLLLSHLILRPFYRRLINLKVGLTAKIMYSIFIVYLCTVWSMVISLMWFSWSEIQLVERTEEENYAGVIVSFLVFSVWSLLYAGWVNWQQKLDETTRRLMLEASYHAAQMSGLKQQLNPHFIFNALNSLRAMIIKDQNVARKMVTEISNMLRYTLYESDKDVVPLSQEIAIVKNYLAIELLRYEGRISIKWHIPDSLMSTNVIPLCIQTLVENAIKHTINQYADGIFIHIRAEEYESNIHICVSNRGKITSSKNEGIGLKNTKERLELIFGEGSTLVLTQKEDELVEAIMIIPKIYSMNPSLSESNT